MEKTTSVEIHGVNLLFDENYADKVQSLFNNIIVLGSMHDEFVVNSIIDKKPHTTYYGVKLQREKFSHIYCDLLFFTNTHIMKKKNISKVKEKKLDGFTFCFSETFGKYFNIQIPTIYFNQSKNCYIFNTSDWEKVIDILMKIEKKIINQT